MIAVAALLGASQIVHHEDQLTVLSAGLVGLLVYLIIHSLDNLLQRSGVEKNIGKGASETTLVAHLCLLYGNFADSDCHYRLSSWAVRLILSVGSGGLRS